MNNLPHPSLRVVSNPNIKQKPTTIDLIIYKHSTGTILPHLARGCSEWFLHYIA